MLRRVGKVFSLVVAVIAPVEAVADVFQYRCLPICSRLDVAQVVQGHSGSKAKYHRCPDVHAQKVPPGASARKLDARSGGRR